MLTRKSWSLLSVLIVVALMAAACAPAATPAPTQPPATQAPAPTQAPQPTAVPATQAPAATAVPATAAPAEALLKKAAPDCNWGGTLKSIEATDPSTVVFTMCVPDPAFPSKVAFSSLGIQ